MTDIVLSIVMLAALALVGGAVVLWRRTGQIKQPALMVLLAVIAVLNVLIWTVLRKRFRLLPNMYRPTMSRSEPASTNRPRRMWSPGFEAMGDRVYGHVDHMKMKNFLTSSSGEASRSW